MIEVEHLTKNYGLVTAIRDVSFSVAAGQIVGFLGPNGAGKSTAMRILACFMPASSGAARVAGHDVFHESMEVRRRIGYLPESVPLYTDMRVAPYLDFVAEVKGVPRAERRRRVGDALERCLIVDVQHRLIGKLSKGYRQRPAGADPGRADHRAGPPADHRDPRAHQIPGRRAHGDPLDAHPARGVDGLLLGRDHQQGQHRGPGPDRLPGRAVLPDRSRGGGDPDTARGGRAGDAAWDSRRRQRERAPRPGRRRALRGRVLT